MNANQKQVLCWGIFIFIAMYAFPPWTSNVDGYKVEFRDASFRECSWQYASRVEVCVNRGQSVEYGFLFNPPSSSLNTPNIATRRLVLQWLVLAISVAGLLVIYSGPEKPPKSATAAGSD